MQDFSYHYFLPQLFLKNIAKKKIIVGKIQLWKKRTQNPKIIFLIPTKIIVGFWVRYFDIKKYDYYQTILFDGWGSRNFNNIVLRLRKLLLFMSNWSCNIGLYNNVKADSHSNITKIKRRPKEYISTLESIWYDPRNCSGEAKPGVPAIGALLFFPSLKFLKLKVYSNHWNDFNQFEKLFLFPNAVHLSSKHRRNLQDKLFQGWLLTWIQANSSDSIEKYRNQWGQHHTMCQHFLESKSSMVWCPNVQSFACSRIICDLSCTDK